MGSSKVTVCGRRNLDNNGVEHFIGSNIIESPTENAEEEDEYEEAGDPGCNHQFVVLLKSE